jgi:hypothetical protein
MINNSEPKFKKGHARQLLNWISFCACFIAISNAKLWPAEASIAEDARLNSLLVHTRQSVEVFWSQFESVSCTESVLQEKLGSKNNAEYRQKSTFDYLALLHQMKDDISVEESRLRKGKEHNPKNISLLLTNGIPTLLMVFHPYYAQSFSYQIEGDEVSGGRKLARIRFMSIDGKPATTALRLRETNYPLSIQGVAWIDFETGAIQKIAAGLKSPIKELNLKALQMEVAYLPQKFPLKDGAFWLPSIATVKIQSERQQWRNVHQYSDYRLFSVTSDESVFRRTETSPSKPLNK